MTQTETPLSYEEIKKLIPKEERAAFLREMKEMEGEKEKEVEGVKKEVGL